MQFLSVLVEGEQHIVTPRGADLVSVTALLGDVPTDMAAFIATPDVVARAMAALAHVTAAAVLPAAKVAYLPVVPRPGKVLCLGLNYKDHAAEVGLAIPDYPVVFMRGPTSLTGHRQPLLVPRLSPQLDYEAELAVVIGKHARHVKAADAHAHVFGVTCFNDASLRDLQFRTSQWTAGKNFDRTGGLGPAIVTLDELPRDPDALAIATRLNGETVQQSNTAQHVFGVKEAVEVLSSLMTLEPGDIIALGTPSGVGMARKPPLWMKAGDTCDVEIEGIGVLSNPVAAEG